MFHERFVLSRGDVGRLEGTANLVSGHLARGVPLIDQLDDSGVRKQCFGQYAGRARGHEQPLVGRSRARRNPFTSRCRASIVTRLEACSSHWARVFGRRRQRRLEYAESELELRITDTAEANHQAGQRR